MMPATSTTINPHATRVSIVEPFCTLNSALCTLLPRQSNHLPPTSIEMRHLDRLRADLDDAIPAVDDVALTAVHRDLTIAQHGPLNAIGACDDTDELQLDRRRGRRSRWPGGLRLLREHDGRRHRSLHRRRRLWLISKRVPLQIGRAHV